MSLKGLAQWGVLLLLVPAFLHAAGLHYKVEFQGLDDPAALKTIKAASQLTSLKKHPPASINSLRYRAEADIPEFLKILHAYGYYEARVGLQIQEVNDEVWIHVIFDPGPIYRLGSFNIHLYQGQPDNPVYCECAGLDYIGVVIGSPALAQNAIDSELRLLDFLSQCGYPLAAVEKRDVVADGKTRLLDFDLYINTGPLSYFGKTTIDGLASVKKSVVERKIRWTENELYTNEAVQKTQNALMDTGLFNSVMITHTLEPNENGQLDMRIELTETKHKSIDVGGSYQTIWGPGVTFGWENRNVAGLGRKLSLQGDLTQRNHSGILSYVLPDFRSEGQKLIWEAEAMHEDIKAYHERAYSLTGRLEKSIGHSFNLSVGADIERLLVNDSVDNGNTVLIEGLINLRWSCANSLLNPTKGITVEYLAVPTLSAKNVSDSYIMQQLQQSYYIPVTSSHRVVIAQKLTFGFILSNSLNAIPVPKRFLGGSEDELRGYQYHTVSALGAHHRPKGGRSAIFYSFEPRFRMTEAIGVVPFFDIGNVWENPFPVFTRRWFKSVGIGVRYFSIVGPFRLDIAFPLDRRKHFDALYKIYVSLGQMF